MKNKFKFMLLFVAVLGMVSCSKDDDGGGTTNTGNVVGTWEATALTYNGTSTSTFGGQTVTTDYDAVATQFNNTTVTFNSDGTFDSAGGGMTVEMTITFMGQTITQDLPAPAFINEGTWSINGNTMTITNSGGDPVDNNIVQLSNTTLQLNGQVTTSVTGAQVLLNYDMTFTKI